MPVTESPVIALKRIVVECDRCGKKKTIEQTEDAPTIDAVGSAGWQQVGHPHSRMGVGNDDLVFDTRSCMSAWFATFVRVLYGGPEELPKRQTKPKAPEVVSPLRKGAKSQPVTDSTY